MSLTHVYLSLEKSKLIKKHGWDIEALIRFWLGLAMIDYQETEVGKHLYYKVKLGTRQVRPSPTIKKKKQRSN